MLNFNDPVTTLPKIPKRFLAKLKTLGIETVGDLLYHFPFRYEDFSLNKKINETLPGETVTIAGRISKIKNIRSWKKKMSITEAFIEDGTGEIKAVWFNNPLPLRFLGEGKYVRLSGKISADKKGVIYFQHPNFEMINKAVFEKEESTISIPDTKNLSTGILAPVYPETQGITSYWFRKTIRQTLNNTRIIDFVPQDILKSQKLDGLQESLEKIHFPKTVKESEEARRRFAFEKMFLIQIKALQIKKDWENEKAVKIKFQEKEIKKFVKNLPFQLTNAQKKSAWQIIKDLERNQPMNRLLEGDVGSGKTVVATLACLSVALNQKQSAILAPTEVLAIQHHQGIQKFFENYPEIKIGILTASQCKINQKKVTRKTLFEELSGNKIAVLIGTHAILQDNINFKKLSLVIIDEQHRFGVSQRALLQKKTSEAFDGNKKTIPHLLTMTATPIPRTLSLAIFGNLDLSVIDEYPKGKKKIITNVITPDKRNEVYNFIRKEVSSGRQIFVICPLVEESSKISEVKSVTEEHKNLQKIFPELRISLLHGKMKPKEKNIIMSDFKERKSDILVSTSVIEVGIDIPNATAMIIEGAERFGLAQLHQFRGRVGRGQDQSYCFLFTSGNVQNSTSRLRSMEKTNDGFKIAEADLKLRGPGQFLGTIQSGVPDVTMESLSDIKLIQSARTEAQRIIAFDSEFKKLPLLKKEVEKLQDKIHLE
ncbi:MAG: ATP-dependent DNA helicase RecG [Patescibacteria group bacterium]|jgi:ATP-dependent DNA helicase RecG|nr:ATP-dependent DNA helicase RecG [Patescibacteria group bacterium]